VFLNKLIALITVNFVGQLERVNRSSPIIQPAWITAESTQFWFLWTSGRFVPEAVRMRSWSRSAETGQHAGLVVVRNGQRCRMLLPRFPVDLHWSIACQCHLYTTSQTAAI